MKINLNQSAKLIGTFLACSLAVVIALDGCGKKGLKVATPVSD